MLARRLTPILPDLALAEALETTRIHSVAGHTGARIAFVMIQLRIIILAPECCPCYGAGPVVPGALRPSCDSSSENPPGWLG